MKTRILLECGLRSPLGQPLSFLLIRRPCKPLFSMVDVVRTPTYTFSSPRRLSSIPVHPPHCRHQLGAPNSRVTRDAPLAWLGCGRLLGAQMIYVNHLLSLFFTCARSRGCYSLRFPHSPSTYLCTGMAIGKEVL